MLDFVECTSRFCGLVVCSKCLMTKAMHPKTSAPEEICDKCTLQYEKICLKLEEAGTPKSSTKAACARSCGQCRFKVIKLMATANEWQPNALCAAPSPDLSGQGLVDFVITAHNEPYTLRVDKDDERSMWLQLIKS